MATIGLDRITKVYPNGFQAVDEVSLDVGDGEFMVLVGPSGCGKTTVLRMVAGLEAISGGTLRIGGRVVNDVGAKERDIAMVFQNYALYPHMTVEQNIGFALKLRRFPKAELAQRVTEATRVLGLTPWAQRKPAQLSGGQSQRVAMGRAIVREPSVFLMDEPLSNLDAKLRVQMRAEVSRIQRRLGVATLYVTHDQVEAMTMGDRVAVMHAGRLQQCDRPQTIYDRPRNVFVAAFIGSPAMNLYQATLDADARTAQLGSQTIALTKAVGERHPRLIELAGRPIVVGMRPEHLPLAGNGGPAIDGEVDLVEALGSDLLVHFSIDAQKFTAEGVMEEDEQMLASGAGVARVDPRAPVRQGERVRLAVDCEQLHFFDPTTGDAL
jgi:multiple sugar transport system ATP-binding protein